MFVNSGMRPVSFLVSEMLQPLLFNRVPSLRIVVDRKQSALCLQFYRLNLSQSLLALSFWGLVFNPALLHSKGGGGGRTVQGLGGGDLGCLC